MITEINTTENSFQSKSPMTCYISLGSNMGKPEENLEIACNRLESIQVFRDSPAKEMSISLEARSPIYLTEPQNIKEQPFFANQVLKISCVPEITPCMLLHLLLEIENTMGRVRSLRFGPRIIDLDILLIEGVQMNTSELILPHPRMCERAFVLVPLSDIAGDLILYNGKCVKEVLQTLSFSVQGNIIYQE